MKTSPIVAAQVSFVDGVPFAPEFGDVYHSRAGALAQAQHVFLRGNGLPERWRGRERFVVLETGFGLGNNLLATWDAWRADPQRPARLEFISIERHPLTQADLRRAHAGSPLPALAEALVAQWPPLTHNLHAIDFDGGRVRLLLAFGDVQAWLPELLATVDAFYLDGFAPSKNPAMWDPRLFKALGRLAAPGASAATWSVAREVRDGLRSAGFAVEQGPGFATKRSMTVARFAPTFTPRRPPARVGADVAGRERRALVIGAGLAGAWAAHALAAEGWDCTLWDRRPAPAQETSGNPAGLFHGVVTPEDGAHARLYRACALHAARCLPAWLSAGVPGQVGGLLRLSGDELARMQAIVERQGLPADYVQALDGAAASRLAGAPLTQAAWHYPAGGWLAPGALVRALAAGHRTRMNAAVASLRRGAGGWQLLDAEGAVMDEAAVVVLANARDAARLLGQPDWSLFVSRGQVTLLREAGPPPRLPLAGAGYVVPLPDDRLLCGATNEPGDTDKAPRQSDDLRNLAQLQTLLGRPVEPDAIEGHRVGLRLSPHDRLPIVGGVPAEVAGVPSEAGAARLDQPRFVPRTDGLYVLTALGSRGITTAPLLARTLAAWISGATVPLEASLLDAVDVARFVARASRQRTPAGRG